MSDTNKTISSDIKTVNPEEKSAFKTIDLRESIIIPNDTLNLRSDTLLAKKRKQYDLDDEEIKNITLDNDITVKLIANNKGIFVDFRKYYKGYPTKKGIRVLATKFLDVAGLLEEDIKNRTK